MKNIKSLKIISAFVLSVLATPNLYAYSFDGIVAFGDSLTCNGNACVHAQNPSSICHLYPQGRFTDGGVWLEVLSEFMGFEKATPSLAGGNNFAYGGATTGWATSPNLLNVGHQIEAYLEREDGRADAKKLFVIWVGGNDIKNEIIPVNLISNLRKHIIDLTKAGGRTFLIPNFPPLGQTPLASGALSVIGFGLGNLASYFELVPSTDSFHKDFTSLTGKLADGGIQTLNARLEEMLLKLEHSLPVKIYRLDSYKNFNAVKQQYPEEDLFLYDLFHPSAFAHSLIAQEVFQVINQG